MTCGGGNPSTDRPAPRGLQSKGLGNVFPRGTRLVGTPADQTCRTSANAEKRAKDLYDAQNYLTMMQAKLDDLKEGG